MDITYLGHSSFRLQGKTGTVVTDPYPPNIGLTMPQVSADIITVSHHHDDHDAVGRVKGTTRRSPPFIIDAPGEYELLEISVIGLTSFHDDNHGADRGKNTVMVIIIDGIKIAHLGDLGHPLSKKQLEAIGPIDVLLVPVGGFYTIGPKRAVEIAHAIEPSVVVPMHYQTPQHSAAFNQLVSVDLFTQKIGQNGVKPQEKLTVTPGNLPEEMEVVVLQINGD